MSLTVSDGLMTSDPSSVSVIANATSDAVIVTLGEAINTINLLAPDAFRNPNLKNALTNKLNATISDIQAGSYEDALLKLEYDILAKTNGCAVSGSPDKNDWINNCSDQGQIYPVVISAITILWDMVQNP